MGTTTKVVDREYLRSQFKNFNDILVKPKIQDLENRKVDKVAGKGLSSNDFTDALKTKLEGLSNYDDTSLVNAINTLNGDINTAGSVAKTTADAVAAIVAGAPSDFDTLKEISDWISSHADSAAAMNSAIQDNTAAIALLNGNENTSGSVAHSIKEAFDALAYEIEDTDIDFANLDKIIISGDSTVTVGETIALVSSVSGVTWSSSDSEVATVDQSGVVTPVASGEVTITATKNGYTSGTKVVTSLLEMHFTDNPGGTNNYTTADSPLKMAPYSTHYLQILSGKDTNGDNIALSDWSDITITSSDDTVATAEYSSENNAVGIRFIKPGTAIITASKPGYTDTIAYVLVEGEV